MSVKKEGFIKGGMLAAATLAMFALAPYALATPVQIGFNGVGGSGHVSLTVGPDTVAGDPAGAQAITHANGTFSDVALGISNASITGVMALNFATPPPDETLLASYSFHVYDPANPAVGFSYDNLFYADGSPLVCIVNGAPTYPFAGGFLDIFGVTFTLSNGDLLGLWSNGVTSGGLNYGFNLVHPDAGGGYTSLDSQSKGVYAAVPEPSFIWLFGAGVLGLFAWQRSVEKKRVQVN